MMSKNFERALAAMRSFPASRVRNPQAVAEALQGYTDSLEEAATAAQDAPLVQTACAQFLSHLLGICQSPRELSLHEVSLLTVWPAALEDSLQRPRADSGTRLSQLLLDAGVPSGLDSFATLMVSPGPSSRGTAAAEASNSGPSELEQALIEIADVAQTMHTESNQSLSQDGVLRYAMAVMQLRDLADKHDLLMLLQACDDVASTLADLMDSPDGTDPAGLEILAAFAQAAPLMCMADEPVPTPLAQAKAEMAKTTEAAAPAPSAVEVANASPLDSIGPEITAADAAPTPAAPPEPPEPLVIPPSIVPAAVTDTQNVSLEMRGLLQAELGGVEQSFHELLGELPDDAAAGVVTDAYDNCADVMDRLGRASEAVGLLALHSLLAQLSRQLRVAGAQPAPSASMLSEVVVAFLEHLDRYVAAPNAAAHCGALVDVLRHEGWLEPLLADAALSLVERLADVVLTDEPVQREARAQYATDEDVSLALPDDLDGVVLENLLQELPHQTQAFTEAIGRISNGLGALSDVETAKRAAHTLKGAANTVGARGIANLTHHLEDILMVYSADQTLPGGHTATLLIRAGDCLEAMNEALQGTGPTPSDAREVYQAVLDRANSLDEDGLMAEAPVQPTQPLTGAQSQTALAPQAESLEAAIAMLRIPTQLADELLRLVGESITTNAQTQERLRVSLVQTRSVQAQNRLLRQLVGELDALVDIRGIAAKQQQSGSHTGFDALEMQQYSELHTVTNRLMEAVTDANEITNQGEESLAALGETLEVQSRLQLESQDAVLRTRMVRVETVVPRLQRGVRQAARLLDKEVHLTVVGGDTLIDGQVLNDLIDPLMHVLRNAVDHGIETPTERRTWGKTPAGQIALTFTREGNHVAVRCQDDGRGLDLEAIKTQAVRLGLVDSTYPLNDERVAELILASGFSTRNEATQLSGRGIGMDIVNQRVLDLKGTLALHSVPAQGLKVEIRIPLTMLSTHSLLVRVGKHTVAVSTRNIEDIHFVMPDQIKRLGDKRLYQTEHAVHDVIVLDDLLNLPGAARATERAGFAMLLVRQSQGLVRAVQVQEIFDTSNLVLKTLGEYVPHIPGVAGAAILGDGSVVPVVDLPDLLRAGPSVRQTVAGRTGAQGAAAVIESSGQRRVLVVDDSLSARRGTAMVMKDAGFEVRTAIDGLDAVALLDKFLPDIILADMEMPRMNGLELTSHVRRQASTRHVPVIMITSRSTDKHRQQAMDAGVNVYLTKPFNDDLLLTQTEALLGALIG